MESSLECAVCFAQYNSNENQPKSLPCGHTICASCVKDNLKAKEGKMNCPFCRTSCGTGVKTLDDFPTTFALMNLLDTEDQKSPSKTLSPREKDKEILEQKKQAEYDRTGAHISSCNDQLLRLSHAKETQASAIHSIGLGKKKLLEELKKLDEEEQKAISMQHQLDDIVALGNNIVKGLEALQDRIKSASSLPGLDMASQDVQRYYKASQEWETSRVNNILQENKHLTNEDLESAVKAGDCPGVTLALQQGADPNTTCAFVSPRGFSLKAAPVLVYAGMYEDEDVIKALLEAKNIKVDFLGDAIHTALLQATITGHNNVVQLLLSGGADPNLASGNLFRPPLVAAAHCGHLNICRMLLQHGAKADITDINGCHAIFLAAAKGHQDVVELLIQNGGDPQLKVKGFTASDIARRKGRVDLADWLQNQRKLTNL